MHTLLRLNHCLQESEVKTKEKAADTSSLDEDEEEADDTVGSVLFVKNLNFATTDDNLKQVRLNSHFLLCKSFFRICTLSVKYFVSSII